MRIYNNKMNRMTTSTKIQVAEHLRKEALAAIAAMGYGKGVVEDAAAAARTRDSPELVEKLHVACDRLDEIEAMLGELLIENGAKSFHGSPLDMARTTTSRCLKCVSCGNAGHETANHLDCDNHRTKKTVGGGGGGKMGAQGKQDSLLVVGHVRPAGAENDGDGGGKTGGSSTLVARGVQRERDSLLVAGRVRQAGAENDGGGGGKRQRRDVNGTGAKVTGGKRPREVQQIADGGEGEGSNMRSEESDDDETGYRQQTTSDHGNGGGQQAKRSKKSAGKTVKGGTKAGSRNAGVVTERMIEKQLESLRSEDAHRAAASLAAISAEEVAVVVEDQWAQCEEPSCLKWRKIPASAVEAGDLPDVFKCSLNRWDLGRSNCSVPEELDDDTS